MKYEIGAEIITDNGTGKVLASSIQGSSDTCINLYLCEFQDGHNEVVAADNANNWVVGDENDSERNFAMVSAIGAERLDDFAETVVKPDDEGLRDWIINRIAECGAEKAVRDLNSQE